MARIFISYSRKDEPFARKLATDLDRLGGDVWIDVDDIPPGVKWSTAIQEGLDCCDVMLVIISPDSMASRNVEDEWQAYLDEGKPVIPILLHPAKVHFQLRRVQYIDFQRDYKIAFGQLYAELRRKNIPLAPLDSGASISARPTLRVSFQRVYLAIVAIALIGIALLLLLNEGGDNNSKKTVTVTTQAAALIMTEPVSDASLELPRSTEIREPTLTPTPKIINTPSLTPNSPIPTVTPTSINTLASTDAESSNKEIWPDPLIQTFDGVEMVYVPAGCFMMGSTDEQIDYIISLGGRREWYIDEQPSHKVCLDAFWLDRTEVTNAQYGETTDTLCNAYSPGPNQPRNCVSWTYANAFCEGRGSRLPTEAEWEYAARGPEGLLYPWGNTFVGDNVVYNANSGEYTLAVGSKPENMSWVGAMDMSGNLSEWVADWYSENYYATLLDSVENPIGPATGDSRVLRGGSFYSETADLQSTTRFSDIPGGVLNFYGFRCARSASQ